MARGGRGRGEGVKVRELRRVVDGKRAEGVGVADRARAERARKELDEIVGRECVKCGEVAVRGIDEPFVAEGEDKSEWAL